MDDVENSTKKSKGSRLRALTDLNKEGESVGNKERCPNVDKNKGNRILTERPIEDEIGMEIESIAGLLENEPESNPILELGLEKLLAQLGYSVDGPEAKSLQRAKGNGLQSVVRVKGAGLDPSKQTAITFKENNNPCSKEYVVSEVELIQDKDHT
ncbi:hypothetical protein PVK06_043702 [Gossypium arboreum]|uniref:Uncharacterized protein n=1 Tax=Gossypium arboreum TaxID=29729 RepID=A0ABR0MPD0_GOSAR|nr:hypothetical protein PVK06_043702 [Gossypium arboreum]